MKVIDNTAIKLTTTFGDLAIGEAFIDNDGDINIKTDLGASIYWAHSYWETQYTWEEDEYIIPIEATYTFERKA